MPSETFGHLPITAAQEGIWIGQQCNLSCSLYNACEFVELEGNLDLVAFEQALRQAVTEAEAVNMRFVSESGRVWQVSAPVTDWPLPIIHVDNETGPREAALRWMNADLENLVDLERGPLFAHALIKIGPNRYFWSHRAHHIALDGYGFSLVAQRVAQLYAARKNGHLSNEPWFGSLQAVVEDDLAYRNSSKCAEDGEFWRAHFAGLQSVASLSGRSSIPCGQLVRHGGQLSHQVMDALRTLADQNGATWLEAVFAIVATYVAHRVGVPEVVLGVPMMGRIGSVAACVPAMIMNIVPLRVPVGLNACLPETIRAVADEMRALRKHSRYRSEVLRRELKLVGGGKRLYGPMVNVMPFDYQLDFPECRATSRNLFSGTKFVEDIAFEFYVRPGGMPPVLDINANANCYTVDEIVEHFNRLSHLLADPLAKDG